jgi:predicted permease
MSSFFFSLNAVLPIFLLILLGWVLKDRKVINGTIKNALNTIAFNVTLPLMLFRDIAVSDVSHLFNPAFIGYALGGTLLTFLLTWLLAEWCIKDKTAIGAFVQGSFRGNFAIIGLLLINSVLGHTAKGALMTAFAVPMYNILAVIVLSFRSKNPQPASLKSTLVNIAKNPLILGILAGVPFSLFNIPLFTLPATKFLATTIHLLADITNPVALLAIGASISLAKIKAGLPKALAATAIKIVISPLLFTGLAFLLRGTLGFSHEDLLVLMILFGVPTAVASFIMASKMNNDEDLAANIVLLTSLLSVFTLTLGIYIFKAAGLIG